MNSRFGKYCKLISRLNDSESEVQEVLDELHKSFASLTQEEQKYAYSFLGDAQSGNVVMEENKSLRDYITEYQSEAKNDQVYKLAMALGVDEDLVREFMGLFVTEANINEFGRFDNLKATADLAKAQTYFSELEGKSVSPPKVRIKIHQLLQKFILEGGFEI